jgi:chitinase domain-containing protein 1
MKRLLNYVLIAILIASASATINPSKNKKNKQKTGDDVKEKSGPQEKSVYERNLVDNEPLASDIIAEAGTYFKETGLKNFNGTVLGYVTPVSSHRFSSIFLICALIFIVFHEYFSGTRKATTLPSCSVPNST